MIYGVCFALCNFVSFCTKDIAMQDSSETFKKKMGSKNLKIIFVKKRKSDYVIREMATHLHKYVNTFEVG